jgi:nucleoid-associated protein YgaU
MSALTNDEVAVQLEQLTNLYLLNNILLEIQKNLNFLLQGSQGTIISVNGANLFQLASKYYGDWTLWTSIANANGLIDPLILPNKTGTPINLIIPQNPKDTGGVLQI